MIYKRQNWILYGWKNTRCLESKNNESIFKNIIGYGRKLKNKFVTRQSEHYILLLKALKNTVF